jgi:diaphanous 1
MAKDLNHPKHTSRRISSASSYPSLLTYRFDFIVLTICSYTDYSFEQKSAVEVHDAEDKNQASKAGPAVIEPAATSEPVSYFVVINHYAPNGILQTVKDNQETSSQSLMPPLMNSQGRYGGRQTVNRGDLDQVIRSMRDGKRVARPNRSLSKIFLDGGRPKSRIHD